MKKNELVVRLLITVILAEPLSEKFDNKKLFYDSEHTHTTNADYGFNVSLRNLITTTVTASLSFGEHPPSYQFGNSNDKTE